jgi:hypothetical protein
MIIIHAVQKLLNTSKLKTSLYVTQAASGQLMHSWYARLVASSFTGKLLVMYVHQPSLLTIVCPGKTVKGTWPQFIERLPALLKRFDFPAEFIEAEMKEINGYVVAKTNSKSMLAHMNQIVWNLEYHCARYATYESIDLNFLEDLVMGYLYTGQKANTYTTAKKYWQEVLHGPK